MHRAVLSSAALAALIVAGCATPSSSGNSGAAPAIERSSVLALGDHYESSLGSLFVIRVQDEFRLIRCIPAGPIAGCYEDLLVIPLEQVKYNRWLTVEKLPGLEVAIVAPKEVAFRFEEGRGTPK
jgi:hypothetical protein